MLAPFKTYEDIPPLTKEYVICVADAKMVEEIPLDDINGFMLMMFEAEVENDLSIINQVGNQ